MVWAFSHTKKAPETVDDIDSDCNGCGIACALVILVATGAAFFNKLC